MRRTAALLLLCVVLALAATAPALAQARDPFRPPAGSAGGGGVSQPPPSEDADGTPPRTGGLPRTGQDVAMLIAAGFALMTAGGALRLTGRLLAT